MRAFATTAVLFPYILRFTRATPTRGFTGCDVSHDIIPLPAGQTALTVPKGRAPIAIMVWHILCSFLVVAINMTLTSLELELKITPAVLQATIRMFGRLLPQADVYLSYYLLDPLALSRYCMMHPALGT